MSHIRLIGLLLFITAITLALAAAATQTTHVQVSSQWGLLLQGDSPSTGSESSTTIPPLGSTPTDYTNVQMPPAEGEPPQLPPGSAAPEGPYAQGSHVHDWDYEAHQAHFDSTAIPIAWPLLATGGAGLLLWFIQAPAELRPSPKKRSTKRKRRR
ncbi:MAG: hypothetical protein ACTHK7_00825 [Aureliella sp.]